MEGDIQNTGKAMSKKGLYIVIGILVILVLVFTLKKSVMAGPGADLNRNLDGSTTYSSDQGTITVGGGKLPSNWPSDVPRYEKAEVQYSGEVNPETGQSGTYVVFMTADKPDVVGNFYKKELDSNGWTIESAANVEGSTVISAKKGTRILGISIIDARNGKTTVTVGVSM